MIRVLRKTKKAYYTAIIVLFCTGFSAEVFAQSDEELAKKRSNPVASLISVPFQFNYDDDYGMEDDGQRFSLNIQPVVSYTTPTAVTYGLNTESSYYWKTEDWSIPINLTVSRLTKMGKQPLSIGGGLRYWAESPPGGAEGLGFRVFATLLFPQNRPNSKVDPPLRRAAKSYSM